MACSKLTVGSSRPLTDEELQELICELERIYGYG